MQQNLHLLSSTGGGLPTSLWVPATERVALQEAWQTSLGATFLIDEHKGSGLYPFSLFPVVPIVSWGFKF